MIRNLKTLLISLMIFGIPFMASATQFATITVDGDPGDWTSLTPAYVDTEGDGTCGAQGDFRSIYTAMDANYAYIMVDTWGIPIDSEATLELNFQFGFQNLHTNFRNTTLWAWQGGDRFPISGYQMAWGDVMEAKIPLSELGNPGNFDSTFVNIWISDNPCDVTYTTPFRWKTVIFQVKEYDPVDFPGVGRSVFMLPAAKLIPDPPPVDPMPVSITGIGSFGLNYKPAWKQFWRVVTDPAPGPIWQTTYRFECGGDFAVLDLTGARFRELDTPDINILGDRVSWAPVEYATWYEVWLYPLTPDGYPDESNPPLHMSGRMDQTAYTLPGDIPAGEYAVRVNAREYCQGELVNWEWHNRSCFYRKIRLGDSGGWTVLFDSPGSFAQGVASNSADLWWIFDGLKKIDPNTGAVLADLPLQTGDGQGLSFDGNGRLWMVSYADDRVYQIDLTTGNPVQSWATGGQSPSWYCLGI